MTAQEYLCLLLEFKLPSNYVGSGVGDEVCRVSLSEDGASLGYQRRRGPRALRR